MSSNESPLKPCPFCGFDFSQSDLDLDDDVIYRTGVWHRERGFMSPKRSVELGLGLPSRDIDDAEADSGWTWEINCPELAGGCGAEIGGLSRAQTIEKWNRRVFLLQHD